jgi:hypothetical protein
MAGITTDSIIYCLLINFLSISPNQNANSMKA